MRIIDAHCDAPSQMLRLRDFGQDNARGQVDFPKMGRGGVGASFFALYIPASLKGEDATSHALKMYEETRRQVEANSDKVAFATSKEDIQKNTDNGLISILLGIENASAIQKDFHLLEDFWNKGVRYITLTHSQDNLAGDSCTGQGTWGGLSPFGKELVREMNQMGMLIDLAHSSDNTIKDVLDITSAPVAYTHGCCRALCSHPRNLSDELISGVAETGGVVGMSIYPCFLSDDFNGVLASSGLEGNDNVERDFIDDPADQQKAKAWFAVQDALAALPRPGIERVVEHILHAVRIAGPEHVGIGTDFDGIEVTADGLEDISKLCRLGPALEQAGLPSKAVSSILWDNFLRLLQG